MRKFLALFILLIGGIIAGCDLQPKIASIPDSIGDFISERYPTLLAEPDSEIYQTAVADYGVYASPTVYGDGDVMAQDYVLYSPMDDYMLPNQDTNTESEEDDEDIEDTDTEDDVEEDNNDEEESGYAPDTDVEDLVIPDYVNEKPVAEEKKVEEKKEIKSEPKKEEKVQQKQDVKKEQKSDEDDFVRAPLREITIEKGDTLYSVSRKYSVPVNDLAVMNKISAPFTLSVGQKLKVPDILSVPKYEKETKVVRTATTDKKVEKIEPKAEVKEVKKDVEKPVQKKSEPDKKEVKKVEQPKQDVKQKSEPKIDAKKDMTVPVKSEQAKVAKAPVKADVAPKKTEVKKTDKPETKKSDVKKDAKKSDVKKTDVKKLDTKKTETKKTDAKKDIKKSANDKKSDAKNVKQSDKKKTDAKKSTAKKKQTTTKRTAQKMVARSSSKFSWPVRGKILSGYGSKSNGLFNDGINIKANRGTTVSAAENGFVAYAGNEVKGMGNLVIIQHADGWMTVYAHMDSMSVKRGHGVTVGQKIGTVGTSGKVDQPQLHFEIRKGTKAYNPVNYLKK